MVEKSNGAPFEHGVNTEKALLRKENVDGNDSSIHKGTKKEFKKEAVVVTPLVPSKDSSTTLTNHLRTLPSSSRVLISSSASESDYSLP